MSYGRPGLGPLNYEPCRYDGSKLLYRGPKRRLEGEYVAFLGGTDTYGKFIPQPFPALIERTTGVKCINFGWQNAGIDVYLNDPGVLGFAARARLTVVQVACAQNMSNRYYQVHPRRNDRFVRASESLRALYDDVDFTEFHITRHMLCRLQELSLDRFEKVKQELQNSWVPRMRLLIERIGGPVVVVWFSARGPDQPAMCPHLSCNPGFVSRQMLETLRGAVHEVVEVTASAEAQRCGIRDMVFAQCEASAAGMVMSPSAHDEACRALLPVVTGVIGG